MLIPKELIVNIHQLDEKEAALFTDILKITTVKYDNIFNISFPYSAGIHQASKDGRELPEWQFHMHCYLPILRSESIKKIMVGYEMLAEP